MERRFMTLMGSEPTKPGESNVFVFIASVMVLAIVLVVASLIITLKVAQPVATQYIMTLRSFVEPIIFALLAVAVQQYHASVNSRQTEWMRVASELARIKGMQEERDANDWRVARDAAAAAAAAADPQHQP